MNIGTARYRHPNYDVYNFVQNNKEVRCTGEIVYLRRG